QNEDQVNKMPLLDMKEHPIGRDKRKLGYEPAFELKQVQAFVQVIKDMLDQENPF
ncbi:LysR family transcriptional regulator, partial [Bacillus spizizenii]|nr:LysR family transcriptional regulator [Bacillus spizizenii]